MRLRHTLQPRRRRHRRYGMLLRSRTAPTPPDLSGAGRFEVRQRSEAGPVRRFLFDREQDAIIFAETVRHWMASRRLPGSVQVLWPSARGGAGT